MLFCVTYGLMTFSFIYRPLIVTFPEPFQKEVTTPFIVLAVFFAPLAGVFLIGDSGAGIQGMVLGYNNQEQLQYFSICHPVNLHGIFGFIL